MGMAVGGNGSIGALLEQAPAKAKDRTKAAKPQARNWLKDNLSSRSGITWRLARIPNKHFSIDRQQANLSFRIQGKL